MSQYYTVTRDMGFNVTSIAEVSGVSIMSYTEMINDVEDITRRYVHDLQISIMEEDNLMVAHNNCSVLILDNMGAIFILSEDNDTHVPYDDTTLLESVEIVSNGIRFLDSDISNIMDYIFKTIAVILDTEVGHLYVSIKA